MKQYLLVAISFVVLIISCEKPGDCVKSTGKITSKTFDGLSFDKILINKGIAAVIIEGATYNVEVRAGENLISDIDVKVENRMLTVSDNTSCNWTREYGATVVYITAPNITDIYSKTEKRIVSEGILTYNNLRLAAMDNYDGYAGVGTGDMFIQVQNQQLTIENNTVARFFLSGTSQHMAVNFYESGGIFHGEDLRVNEIQVYHRGTNDIVVHPLDAIRGDIYNIGNVIGTNRPEIVAVNTHYQGRMIF